MACECPAVVEGPLYLHVGAGFDPVEKEFVVDVVVVDIVKPEDVWIVFICPIEEFPCG